MLYCFEGYELDRLQWQLRFGSEIVPLSPKSFDLLLYLIEARPRVVGKDELLNALWPDQFVEENNLAQQVSTLRKSLSRHTAGVKFIETVAGRGYQFTAAVIEASASSHDIQPDSVVIAETSYARIVVEEEIETHDAPTTAPASSSRALSPSSLHKHRPRYLLIYACLMVLIGIAGWWSWHWRQNHFGGPPVTVVLVPLEGTTGDSALDGVLGDAVRFDLSQSPTVTVAPRSLVESTLRLMEQKPGDALTQPVAREVCERINGQAVVHARVARNGQHFLLAGEAISCVDSATIASATEEAERPEDIRVTANRLARQIRQKLGESRASIARFETPEAALETTSLEALKTASAANKLFLAGKWPEMVVMEKQAIALDPKFASAWFDLSTAYMNSGDMKNAREAIEKAYELKSFSSPLTQLTISARYDQLITGDLYKAEKDSVVWTQLYPRYPLSWNQLSLVREDLGEWALAAEASRKEVELRPDVVLLREGLAQELFLSGNLKEARTTMERVIAMSPDFESAHVDLARLAFTTEDHALSRQQLDWLSQHPDSPLLLAVEAELAISAGRFHDAMRWAEHSAEIYQRQGDSAAASAISKSLATEMIGAGDRQDGVTLFHQYPLDAEEPAELLAQAVAGEGDKADASLKIDLQEHPEATKLGHRYAPLIRGWSSIQTGHPQDAIKALNQPGTLSVYGDLDYARGMAYLQNNQPEQAAAAFRSLVDNPYRDQTFQMNVAWLGLARSLSKQGDRSGAAKAYVHFLSLWHDADANAALYLAAKSEAASLANATP